MRKALGLMTGLFVLSAVNVWAVFSIGTITVTGTNSTAATNITISAPLVDATPGHTNAIAFTITSTNGLSWRSFSDSVTNSALINTNWNPYFTGEFIIDIVAYDDVGAWPIPATASTTVTVTRAASASGKVNSVKYSSAPYNAAGAWSNVDTTLNAGIRLNDTGLLLDSSGIGFVFCNLLNATNDTTDMSGEAVDIAYNDIVRYKQVGTPFRFDVNLHARPRGFMGMGEIKRWIWTPDSTNVPDGPGQLTVDITSCSPWRSSYSNMFQSHVGFAPFFTPAGSATVPTGMIMCTSAHCLDVGSTNTGTQTEMRCGLRVNGHTDTNSYLKAFLSDTFLQQQYQLTNVYDATNVMAGFVQHFGTSTDAVAQVTATFTRIVGGTGTNLVYDYNFDGTGDSGYEARLTFTFQSAVAAQMGMVANTNVTPSAPTNVSASEGTYINKIRLTWNAVTNATSYEGWRNTVDDSSSATKAEGEFTSTTVDDTGVTGGVVYYYWIKAKNAAGTSGFSASASGWALSMSSGVSADYDGDRKADPAIYNEATGTWKIRLSSANYSLVTTTAGGIGGLGHASVVADYDGDRKADPAIYVEETGRWVIVLSSTDYTVVVALSQTLGGVDYSGMGADYDGDRKADPGVYERDRGDWKVMLSSANYSLVELSNLLGGEGYRAVAADYDGDRKADPAIYGESSGVWVFRLSGANYTEIILTQTLGGTGYIPVPADYDGDRKADPAVRSETGNEWIIMLSGNNYTPIYLTLTFE